jgi:hypothetical protein
MPILRMKLDDERYEVDLDEITLDEASVLKRDYGMEDFSTFNYFDPDQMIGLFAVVVKRANPEMSDEEIRTKVGGLKNGPIFKDINKQLEDARKKAAQDPPPAAPSRKSAGSQAKTRKARGARS